MDLTVFDHLQNPILLTDATGKLEYFNFVCSHFFKMPPRKLKAITKIQDLISTTGHDINVELQKAHESQNPVVSPEVGFTVGDSSFTAIFKFIPLGDKVLIHIQDFSIEKQLHEKYKEQILELKTTHDQIVKSDKLTALGELIAGISHEISSPLTVAGDTLYVMSENLHLKKYSKVRTDLVDLEKEFKHIRKIVSNMQSMSKNKEETLEVIDLQDVLRDSLDFLNELNLLDDVKLNCDFKPALVLANGGKLQQVFINFLKNSIDAIALEQDKKIDLKIELLEDGINIHLIDNGTGIKDPSQIFEMFYTTKNLGDGTGLGLTISQKIIESFHGTINIEDSSKGAHFRIELPTLEIESFTATNRYFSGESESEDPKFIICSDDPTSLNTILNEFAGQPIVLILTNEQDRLDDMADSYLADYIIHLKGDPVNKDCPYFNFKSEKLADYIAKMKEVISVS